MSELLTFAQPRGEGFGEQFAEHVAAGAFFDGGEFVDFSECVGAEVYCLGRKGRSVFIISRYDDIEFRGHAA